jgi:hypothetical protein
VNPLQFSWANTPIGPTSVELQFASGAGKLEAPDTAYPHDRPQVPSWNVQGESDGEAAVELAYFTSGITWSADHVALADAGETALGLEEFVRVANHGGAAYEDARVRLVVGTVNLVEKIAQVPVRDVGKLGKDKVQALKREVAMESFARGAGAADAAGKGMEEKQIVEQGLSEYFIDPVEGTESVPTGWSKRMRSLEAKAVPLKIQYRYRPPEYGEQLVRMYLLTNDKPSKLGTTPLPDGAVRAFRDNGRGGLSFLTSQSVKYVPIGDKVELNLGPDQSVIFELVQLRASRDELWLHVDGTDVFRRVGPPAVQVEVNASVAGWDEHEVYGQRERNYTAKAVEVEVRRAFPGHVAFRSNLNPVPHDYRAVQFTAAVDPRRKADLPFEVVRHQGRNAKQDNVTLETADVKP